MLFAFVSVAIPVSADESVTAPVVSIMDPDKVITDVDTVKGICKAYKEYNFSTNAEMFNHELELGYLDSITYGDYAVYVNRYTGCMYYVNHLTGQILTSNPIDSSYKTKEGAKDITTLPDIMMGQLEITFFKLTDTTKDTYDSLKWIQDGSFLSVTQSGDSLAVEYTLGLSTDSFISPYAMLYTTALEHVINPIFNKIAAIMQEKCGDFDESVAASKNLKITSYNVSDHDVYRTGSTELYDFLSVKSTLTAITNYALAYFDNNRNNADYKEIKSLVDQANAGIFNSYRINTADEVSDALKERVAALANGQTILIMNKAVTNDVTLPDCRKVEKALKILCPDYTLDMANEHEQECGYDSGSVSVPCFRATIVYSIDADGSLVVDVPSNLISFDETTYAIENITPLKYFGAADMGNDGYVFYPDGSGTVLNFDDFYFGNDSELTNTAVYIDAPVYGKDYCYSTITGAHREQITMPVYGLVSSVEANDMGLSAEQSKVNNAYFAIIEEGESLTKIGYTSGGGTHKYISAFVKYNPNPTDTYDLSQSISVSGLGSYTVVASASYSGSLKTRYVMLVDDNVAAAAAATNPTFSGYSASYVGMASYYRDYLERNGAIELLDDVYDDLPLYIEALGSISITKKVLSFPVTVSVPLTSFDDVIKMYSELSDAHGKILEKAAEYNKLADELEAENAEKHADEIAKNRATAESYTALAEKVIDIKNINFRLTGFTNGGMHFTYPAKVNWERAVGGKKGFNKLLEASAGVNSDEGANFGVYPDFDFMYINNVSSFDAINVKKIAACMVDNRYASKQLYSSVVQKFESSFALVVSAASLDLLYSKFLKQYSKYDANGISVSTLGSEVNSNFSEDTPVIREESKGYISALLGKMSETYSIMSDNGNIYTVKHLDHILNASIDSSHLNYSSYAVPFYGMVLHGYVNYTGTPINYSGSPKYEILRSIENGASLYYVLCTQNTNHLKEDSLLSKYYGIDYENWFDKIAEQYAIINEAIGDLQQHKIVDHSIIYAERIIDETEMNNNYSNLISEFLTILNSTISEKIDTKIKEMRENNQIGKGINFTVSAQEFAVIIANVSDRLNLDVSELEERFGITALVSDIINSYSEQYNKADGEQLTVTAADISYKSKYHYVTDSVATDKNYVTTDFTCDNGNVVMVTYERVVDGEKDTVVFLLNYNIFSVKIKADESLRAKYDGCDEDGYITLDSYGYVKIQ